MPKNHILIDDGTMDTVVEITCSCGCQWVDRISTEAAAEYRDSETGEMVRFDDLVNDWCDDEPCVDCGA